MTTTVVVHPAGHRVKVTKQHRNASADSTAEEVILKPGSPAQTFYVHSSLDLQIAEVAAEESDTRAAEERAGGYAVDAED